MFQTEQPDNDLPHVTHGGLLLQSSLPCALDSGNTMDPAREALLPPPPPIFQAPVQPDSGAASRSSSSCMQAHPILRSVILGFLGSLILAVPFIVCAALGKSGPVLMGLSLAKWSLLVSLLYGAVFAAHQATCMIHCILSKFASNMTMRFFNRTRGYVMWLLCLGLVLIIWDQFFTNPCLDGGLFTFGSPEATDLHQWKFQAEAGSFMDALRQFFRNMRDIIVESPGPASCRLGLIRNLVLCGITTLIGFIAIKLLVMLLAIKYQESMFAERIVKNRQDRYIAHQVYQFCRADSKFESAMGKRAKSISPPSLHPAAFPSLADPAELPQQTARSAGGLGRWFKRLFSFGDTRSGSILPVSVPRNRKPKSFILPPSSSVQRVFGSNFGLADAADQDYGMNSATEAKNRAKVIYSVLRAHLSDPSRAFLTAQDFSAILRSGSETDRVYSVFDLDGDGSIALAEMKHALTNVYKEHRNLHDSIESSSEALKALDTLFSFLLFLFLALVYLIIFGLNPQSLIAIAFSVLLAIDFLVKSTLTSIFDSMVLIFVNHPFDIGDRISIQGSDRIYTVHQIHILRTHLLDGTGAEVYYPNAKLSSLSIVNLSRAHEQSEVLDLSLDLASTSGKKLDDFRSKLTAFLAAHPQFYYRRFDLDTAGLHTSNIDKLDIRLSIRCKHTLDLDKKAERHRLLLAAIKECLVASSISMYPKSSQAHPTASESSAAPSSSKKPSSADSKQQPVPNVESLDSVSASNIHSAEKSSR